MPDSSPRLTPGDLATRVLATADSEARTSLIVQLAHGTRTPEQIATLADRFLAHRPSGHRVFLEWIAHVRVPLPDSLIAQLRPLLSDRTIPATVRVHAAARALTSLPDRPQAVMSIARPLTAGLSPLRRLERLRQLQHQVEQSKSLDAILERRELRLKMDCPRCGQRFPREAMVRHLWHEHGLMLEHGKVRSPRRTVEELTAEHAATRDTTVLDRTSLLADPTALRSWVAVSDPAAEDVEPLLAVAAEHRAGLCSGCFAELAPAVSPLPPPLALAPGRIAGDGYTVEIGGADWFRTLTISTPNRVLQSRPDGRRALGTRGLATFAATMLLLLAILVAVFAAKAWASPVVISRLVLVSAVGYGLVWFVRKSPSSPTERAVDAAWTVLARRLVNGNHTSVWLARLCRTSVGHGDPIARAGVLHDTLVRATAGDADVDVQLLAAANVLQIEDESRHGRDRVAGIAELAAAGFRGEEPIEYAEYVAECFFNREREPPPGDQSRFRVLLLGAAFEAGLKPRDLIDLWAVAPNLRRAMVVDPLHRLGMLQGVWTMRPARWERIARADSVYDLCRIAPHGSGRILTEFPDLLLCHSPDPDTEAQLGPVLICARGIVVGGRMLADPDANVRIEKAGRFGGGFELIFGPHRLALERKPVGDFAEMVKEWLRFRAWALLPLLDNYLAPGSSEVAARVLRPFQRRCPQCGTVSAIAVASVGRPVNRV